MIAWSASCPNATSCAFSLRAAPRRSAVALTDVMTRKVVTCEPPTTVSAVMEQMTAGKFRHVPVLDGEKLVGIISIGDVVKLRLHEMEREQSALRDYIQTA